MSSTCLWSTQTFLPVTTLSEHQFSAHRWRWIRALVLSSTPCVICSGTWSQYASTYHGTQDSLIASCNFDYRSVSSPFQLLAEKSYKQFMEPYYFDISLTGCNALCFNNVECNQPFLPAHPQYRSGSQTKAYSRGTLPILSTSCPISVCISLKLYILVCNILQALVHCTMQISQDVLCCNPMPMSPFYLELAQSVHGEAIVHTSVEQIQRHTNQLPIHRWIY